MSRRFGALFTGVRGSGILGSPTFADAAVSVLLLASAEACLLVRPPGCILGSAGVLTITEGE
jgi:hypothetical protein